MKGEMFPRKIAKTYLIFDNFYSNQYQYINLFV